MSPTARDESRRWVRFWVGAPFMAGLYQNAEFPERGSRMWLGPIFVNPMLSIIGYADHMSSCGCKCA